MITFNEYMRSMNEPPQRNTAAFNEFMQNNRDEVLNMVFDALGAGEGAEDAPLSDFQNFEKKILTYPELQHRIQSSNEGAVLQLLKKASQDDNITIGQLITMIAGV